MSNNKHFFTAKSVINLISWLYIATGLAIVSSILFLLTALDHAAKLDRAKRVDIAMKLESRHLQTILEEYSYWDESYEQIILDFDAAWVEGNTGQSLLDSYELDFSLAIKANGQLAYLITNDESEGLEFEQLMANGLENLIESILQNEDEGAVTGYILAGNDVYLVALDSFRDQKTTERKPDSYLSIGKRMDVEYIEELQFLYELPGLRLLDEAEVAVNFNELLDEDNQMIGRLAWSFEQPSHLVAPKVIAVVMPFLGLAVFLTRYFLKRDHADRAAFEEQLYKEATLDPLTNISNRRHFLVLGQQEINAHNRNGRLLALALFDIDRFKVINDTHGHAMGDKALVHLTKLCADQLRESDIFGRIGGDEFAIILRETPLEQAVEVVERVRYEIETCPLMVNRKAINITISMGLASISAHTTMASILQEADIALYRAKKTGRNQIVVSTN